MAKIRSERRCKRYLPRGREKGPKNVNNQDDEAWRLPKEGKKDVRSKIGQLMWQWNHCNGIPVSMQMFLFPSLPQPWSIVGPESQFVRDHLSYMPKTRGPMRRQELEASSACTGCLPRCQGWCQERGRFSLTRFLPRHPRLVDLFMWSIRSTYLDLVARIWV
jgi:hypothetical protein